MYARERKENAMHLAAMLAPRASGVSVSYAVNYAQRAARITHKNAERMCNGTLAECSACHGDGWGCKKCRETGYPTLAREARMLDRLRETLKPFKVRIYEQGDPRGWPLYLIPEEAGLESEDDSRYDQRGMAVCPH